MQRITLRWVPSCPNSAGDLGGEDVLTVSHAFYGATHCSWTVVSGAFPHRAEVAIAWQHLQMVTIQSVAEE